MALYLACLCTTLVREGWIAFFPQTDHPDIEKQFSSRPLTCATGCVNESHLYCRLLIWLAEAIFAFAILRARKRGIIFEIYPLEV